MIKLKLGLLALAVMGIGFFVYGHQKKDATDSAKLGKTSNRSSANPRQNSDSIRLMISGDWIAHSSVNSAAKQSDGSYNYLPLVKDIQPIFNTADIRFCNDPILNGGASLGISGYPKFNSPTEFVTDMGRFGCNLVNTASNHSFDFSQANIDNSVNAWQKIPNILAVAGENQNQSQHDQVHMFDVKGVKLAFLAYTAYSNNDAPPLNSYGVNLFSRSFASNQIKQAKDAGAKFIIVSIRWGTEYSTSVNAEQQQDAQFFADQGVNLVIGHGSHELQPVQQITGTKGNVATIWYSIGNFLNTQEPPETLFNGLPIIDISTKSFSITKMQFLPTYMHYEWTAAQAAADNIAARNHIHMYLLESASQDMINAQQLHTSVDAQKQRLAGTLNSKGLDIPLVTSTQAF